MLMINVVGDECNRCAHLSRRKAKCYCPLQLLAIILFCGAWGAAAMTVALSVGVGDVCMEPQAYTIEVTNRHATHYEQVCIIHFSCVFLPYDNVATIDVIDIGGLLFKLFALHPKSII
jgi:hypothetical protein